jgi:DNA-binding PadR family transcriptional regulator
MMYGPVHRDGAVSALSTKHAVLGLLIERPGYGYDLQQRIDARLGFLRLSESAVYKILERLEKKDGWIEELGEKTVGATRRGAPRVIYGPTPLGRQRFKEWLARPSERACLRDELQAKLNVSNPEDLPALLADAEAQGRECLAEVATLRRPVLATVADPEVPWNHAALMMSDDFHMRFLQMLVDWLDGICELMDERIQRAEEACS